MKLRFTPEAIEDLTRLRDFIEKNNPTAAQRIAKDLLLNGKTESVPRDWPQSRTRD